MAQKGKKTPMEKVSKITICYDSNDDIMDIIIGPSAQEAISVEQEDEVFFASILTLKRSSASQFLDSKIPLGRRKE